MAHYTYDDGDLKLTGHAANAIVFNSVREAEDALRKVVGDHSVFGRVVETDEGNPCGETDHDKELFCAGFHLHIWTTEADPRGQLSSLLAD